MLARALRRGEKLVACLRSSLRRTNRFVPVPSLHLISCLDPPSATRSFSSCASPRVVGRPVGGGAYVKPAIALACEPGAGASVWADLLKLRRLSRPSERQRIKTPVHRLETQDILYSTRSPGRTLDLAIPGPCRHRRRAFPRNTRAGLALGGNEPRRLAWSSRREPRRGRVPASTCAPDRACASRSLPCAGDPSVGRRPACCAFLPARRQRQGSAAADSRFPWSRGREERLAVDTNALPPTRPPPESPATPRWGCTQERARCCMEGERDKKVRRRARADGRGSKLPRRPALLSSILLPLGQAKAVKHVAARYGGSGEAGKESSATGGRRRRRR